MQLCLVSSPLASHYINLESNISAGQSERQEAVCRTPHSPSPANCPGAAACSTMRASMDADIGARVRTVFHAPRQDVFEKKEPCLVIRCSATHHLQMPLYPQLREQGQQQVPQKNQPELGAPLLLSGALHPHQLYHHHRRQCTRLMLLTRPPWDPIFILPSIFGAYQDNQVESASLSSSIKISPESAMYHM
ncbi:hypothetical protein Tco_0551259 [Tanacetum coccineum]